ncbi:class-II fumarase/aspartase family protein [Dactylosporangium sp. CA-092794]|uniref:class-II fumarase/aspartase family protein n=1 Tax=Dactylosporangium sp. CA-092794 TaxID=3239929 RepID=UPI003D8B65D1
MSNHATDSGLLAPVWAGTDAACLVSDEAWLQAMLDVEVALARAQARLGVVPPSALTAIAEAARADRLDLVDLAVRARGAANPVVALVQALTAQVARIDPAAAEYVHRGGTSQDILDSAAMVLAARVLAGTERDLLRCADALAGLAREHRSTAMAGRTMAQHAVPITFGLKAAGWLTLVLDALDRVRQLTESGLPAQLGGAAGTLASYVEYARIAGVPGGPNHGADLMAAFADELGRPEPVAPWHTIRTPLADIGAVVAFVTGALGKLALDVQGMSRTEVGELAEPAAEGRGVSSAMPQKRNPVLATLIVSAARQTPLCAAALSQALLAEDERSAGGWHAEWQPLREALRLVGGAAATAADLCEGLQVFPDRMRANLDLTGGAVVSERLGAVLAPMLGKATAKKLLGGVALAGTGPFAQTLSATPELAGRLDAGELVELLDPTRYLGSAQLIVERVVARYESVLTCDLGRP